MCEICGGPHFTLICPQYVGALAHYYANPSAQPQQYHPQEYPSFHFDDPYQQLQHNQGQFYGQYSDSNSDEGIASRLGMLEEMLVQMVTMDARKQKMLAEQDIALRNRQSEILDLQRTVEDISRRLREEEEEEEEEVEENSKQQPTAGYTYDADGNYLGYTNLLGELFPTFPELGKDPYMEYEDESDEEFIPEPETIMAISVPPAVQHEKGEENTGKLIIDFSCSDDEIDAQLAAYERLKGEGRDEKDEEITLEMETKMDYEVPPPVQQVIYDFGSDSDDEIDEEEWVAYQKSLVKTELIEEEVELGDSVKFMFGAEV